MTRILIAIHWKGGFWTGGGIRALLWRLIRLDSLWEADSTLGGLADNGSFQSVCKIGLSGGRPPSWFTESNSGEASRLQWPSLRPSFLSPRTTRGLEHQQTERGCIRRRPMLLTLSLSRARTGAVTQPRRVGVWKRPAASRSPGPQADSGPIEQDKSGWSGPRPGPICQALLVVGTAAGASHVLTPTQPVLLCSQRR